MTHAEHCLAELERRRIVTRDDRLRAALTLFDAQGIAHINAITGRATILFWIEYDEPTRRACESVLRERAGAFARERLSSAR
jgi:hypothetical protein